MPWLCTPRMVAAVMRNGLSSLSPDSAAPTTAHGAFMPAATLGAPQTISSRLPLPTSTLQTVNRSVLGCFSTARTTPTTTPEKAGATGSHASTSRPDMVSRCASSVVVNAGSTSVRSQLSENCMCRFNRCVRSAAGFAARCKSIELLEKAQIVFEEQAQVVDAITQHGQTLEP